MERNKNKNGSCQTDTKQSKGCYWDWLMDAEIKTYKAWNKANSNGNRAAAK